MIADKKSCSLQNAATMRVQELHEATLRLLELLATHKLEEDLLQKGIEALTTLIEARYGAIGILDEAGQLKQFVHTGITPEEASRIGRLPEGRGLLGAVVREDHVLCLDDMSGDPRSAGFPPKHPPMRSLLASPISHQGRVYGRIYLSEKTNGEPFNNADEVLIKHYADALALILAYHRSQTERDRAQKTLQAVARALSITTGEGFFSNLVLTLSSALGVDYVFVGERKPGQPDVIRTIAFCSHGQIVGNIDYHLAPDTPCGATECKTVCHFPDGAIKLFPEDDLIYRYGIAAFFGHPLLDSAGRTLGLLVVMHEKPLVDKEYVQSMLQLCASRAAAELEHWGAEIQMRQLSSAIEQTADSVLITDPDGIITYVNPAFEKTTGYTRHEAIGRKPNLVKSGQHDQDFYRRLWGAIRQGEPYRAVFINRRKSGELYYEEKTVTPLKDAQGRITHYVSTGKDVTEYRQAMEHVNYLANYDTLTGLPNRVLLQNRLHEALLEADRNNRLVAVMFLDLDHFKIINDTLGHDVGDALLKAVAERLTAGVRHGDTISRLGGDEFTIVLTNVAHVDDVARVARKIIESFTSPFEIDGRELFISPSIGITLYPLDDNIENVLRNADAAMYHAKEMGRNTFQFYTAELNRRTAKRLALETALRYAVERRELQLHYQPQVSLKTGKITGMEALLRWQHPEMGLVPPLEFIPLAEESGLIVPIGEWVLRTACAQARAWHDAGFRGLQVAVNLSGRQFQHHDLAKLVKRVLKETGLDPRQLDLELTENLLIHNTNAIMDTMEKLHVLGVSFSMDDFGTGYSSLSYLKRFPIDTLKIDRSFVRDIPRDPDDAAIAQAVIAIAHSLGIKVIAEGAETAKQLAFLRTHQCDGVQGYLFSKPVTARTMTRLLQKDGPLALRKSRTSKGVVLPRTPRPIRCSSSGKTSNDLK
jgi:diguanylate cyclase (GGDEF)-like protein/PAS domain S-box-containing protein